MKVRLFILVTIFFGACKKDPDPGIVIATGLDIHYTDSNGNNLFPNNTKGYVQDSVNLYVDKAGIRILVFDSAPGAILDYPKRYFFFMENSFNYVRVFTDNNVVGDTAVTYLNLKGKFEDTIKASFTHVGASGILLDKAWVNGKQVSGNRITIIK